MYIDRPSEIEHAMRFTLYYRGPLKSKATPAEKHQLRQHFHVQLAQLWQEKPLSGCRDWINVDQDPSALSLLRRYGAFVFAPLVTESMAAVADLKVQLLWQQPTGSILNAGGDIDNRLKTLFDALKMPSAPDDLPKGVVPEPTEHPFFCLLEDDILVSALRVQTDRLLAKPASKSEVCLFIEVTTRNLNSQWDALP